MATHDYIIDNQTAPALRADLNLALQAIASNNSSASAPSTTYANLWWMDTTNNYLKIRDKNDSNWIIVAEIDVSNSRVKLVSDSLQAASAGGIDIKNNSGTKIIDLAVASEATAKAGTNNTELMTPLRVKQAAATPTGVILPFAGPTAPSDFLLCYGQSLSTSTYADLFAIIGYTYGGSGSSFNVPDLRGRVVGGQDDMGGSSANRLTSPLNGDTLGGAGGSQSHSLTEAELAPHRHFVSNTDTFGNYGTELTSSNQMVEGVLSINSRHEYRLRGGATEATIGRSSASGSGAAHNNVQPTLILNYIIKI
tara:strand:+ start:238 stop:1164 length:927 start_codon:yes stop_codon:yes gene_type:complete